jgi:hypothetical protein
MLDSGVSEESDQASMASTQSLQQLYLSKNMQQAQSLTGPTLARTTILSVELRLLSPLIECERYDFLSLFRDISALKPGILISVLLSNPT